MSDSGWAGYPRMTPAAAATTTAATTSKEYVRESSLAFMYNPPFPAGLPSIRYRH